MGRSSFGAVPVRGQQDTYALSFHKEKPPSREGEDIQYFLLLLLHKIKGMGANQKFLLDGICAARLAKTHRGLSRAG